MLFLFYAYRSLLARLRANLVTVLAVVLFVAGGTMGLTVYLSMQHELVATAPAENVIVMSRGAASERGSKLDLESARKIVLLDGIKKEGDAPLVARELVSDVYVETTQFGRYAPPVSMRGFDDLSMKVHHAKVVEGAAPTPGTLELMVGKKALRHHSDLKLGGSLFLPGGESKIVGVFEAEGSPLEEEVWTPRSALEMHGKIKTTSSVTLVADSASRVPDLVEKINASKDLQAQATSVVAYREQGGGLPTILRLVLILLILLSVVATSAIATTMSAAVVLRLPELAAMVAIGIRRGVLARMVMFESMLLAGIGAILGVLISELVRSQIHSIPLGQTPIDLLTMPIVPVVGLLLGVIVGLVGGIAPAITVRRLDITRTMR